jgi:putative SOS response-associated peptidase YedK
VVAAGFYEWQRTNGRKQPYFVGLKNDHPFALAGLWERWEKHGEPVESCPILTTEANELMQPVHERMPVIVPPDQYGLWLDPRCQDSEELAKRPLGTIVQQDFTGGRVGPAHLRRKPRPTARIPRLPDSLSLLAHHPFSA